MVDEVMQPRPLGYWIRCSMCGQEFWDNQPFAHTGVEPNLTVNGVHPEADWEAWRIQQGIPDGQPYNRRVIVNAPPIPPEPPAALRNT